jgi:hypothetical protein
MMETKDVVGEREDFRNGRDEGSMGVGGNNDRHNSTAEL